MDRIIIEEMNWPDVRAALDAGWDRVILVEKLGQRLALQT